jgi:glycine cleavage system T protein (aminomethyltransferase)
MSAGAASDQPPKRTPLYALHVALGAKMVPFAGYEMPVQYPLGILREHQHTRAKAGLFDVSHMGQAFLIGPDHATTAGALEGLVPADIASLKPGQQRYTQLLNDAGGIVDDLMVTRPISVDDGRLFLVVNASRKEVDYAHIVSRLPAAVMLLPAPERALVALQGPAAKTAMAQLSPAAAGLAFMAAASGRVGSFECHVSRSGYTGEDGFEISVAAEHAEALAQLLLAQDDVQPIGLGARDSLRLEAGLCLYGNDLDELTSPIEAGLTWTIGKRRKLGWDFPGASLMRDQLDHGAPRHRVGIRPDGRTPARAQTTIIAEDGTEAGTVTSGSFGPSLNAPIAMGYVRKDLAADGTKLSLIVRGKTVPATVVPLPFVPHRYVR